MKVLIDTCSLLSFVRYYLHFDNNSILFEFFKSKVVEREILVLDKVIDESRYVAKGIILNSLNYLNDKKLIENTTELFPNDKFFNQLENQFCYGSMKNKLNAIEFEKMKSQFLESADAKLILYGLEFIKNNKDEEIIIVSEETEGSNDNKLFKKLPAICSILDIRIITLPNLLSVYDELKLDFKIL